MNESETALWWARVRAGGPQLVEPGDPFPAGMARLAEPGVTGIWLLPILPDGARPGMTDELGIPPLAVDQPNDTARVLAACLRAAGRNCRHRSGREPLRPRTMSHRFSGRSPARRHMSNRAVVAAIRRLGAAGWPWTNRPGRSTGAAGRLLEPGGADTLRELWRTLPIPAAGDGTEVPL